MKKTTIQWQAHRGGGAYEAPDNTMAANNYTWGLGGIPEADIRTTKDGVMICLHDKTPARTTTAPEPESGLPASELTFEQIREWDAGVRFDPRFAGERVPSLEEVFAAMQGRPERLMYLDLKEADLTKLGEMISRYEVNGQVIFTHNLQQSCIRLKQIAEGVRTMLWIGGDADKIQQKFQAALDSGFESLDQVQLHLNPVHSEDGSGTDWPYALKPEFLQYALAKTKEAGVDLEVLPFRLHKHAVRTLLDLGITWYATDEPSKFLQCIEQ
jgi:glycerophosphoryl diester phosphodiesterase